MLGPKTIGQKNRSLSNLGQKKKRFGVQKKLSTKIFGYNKSGSKMIQKKKFVKQIFVPKIYFVQRYSGQKKFRPKKMMVNKN